MSDEFNFDFDDTVDEQDMDYPTETNTTNTEQKYMIDEENSELAAILYKFINQQPAIYPFTHLFVEKVFDEKSINEMIKNIPEPNFFKKLSDDDYILHIPLREIEEETTPTMKYWKSVTRNICNGALKGFLLQKYFSQIPPHHVSENFNLVLEKKGYKLSSVNNHFPDNHLITIKIPLTKGYNIEIVHENDEIHDNVPVKRHIKVLERKLKPNDAFMVAQHPQLKYSLPERESDQLYLNYTIFTSKLDYMNDMDQAKNNISPEEMDEFFNDDSGY